MKARFHEETEFATSAIRFTAPPGSIEVPLSIVRNANTPIVSSGRGTHQKAPIYLKYVGAFFYVYTILVRVVAGEFLYLNLGFRNLERLE
ncbi:MAG: hypothetical protein UY52_C0007G0015 [Parcubacteria group bacterium GW2011_GWC2_49_9]|nr:MAG: hypothetical protein UY34_C0010G0003 [Parcubacteria group bacterium GW2011_GWA2_48_9]KKW16255.1 MAG: hypothetical protein UY52_C0007G0015 [Parcubacteria group bacterium GW2011_GWC2_49_9]